MKSHMFVGLMLALPVALFTACSDDDGGTGNVGGGGASVGHAGHAGAAGHAGTSGGGTSGSSDGDNAGTAGESTSNGGTGPEGGAGGDSSAGTAGDLGGEGGAAAALNDAQILKALSTANTGEVTAAQVAKPGLQNATVVSFAQMMIDEHTTANTQTLALVSTKHLAPQASDVSESLEAETAALLTTLSNTAAAAFDKVYIDSQIAMHQEVLTLIDSRLIPDAKDADLKALLGTVRTSVATHLANAKTIGAALP